MGTNMTYRVALDSFPEGDKDKGNMAEHWMAASGSTGIPTAFIVNKEGKIAWIGHPASINDQLINEIYDGKFDLVKAAEERKKDVAKREAQSKYSRALGEAIKAKDWDKATTAVDGLENALGDEFKLRLAGTRVKILAGKGDIEGATKLATKVADENQKEVSVQIDIARALADIEEVKAPQLELAAKLADRANELSEGKNFQALDLEARIAFLQGNKEKAVEWATKALDKVPEQGKKYFETRLNSYKEGKLPK
jgi:tetratricopeptide (TPR) repeat protein